MVPTEKCTAPEMELNIAGELKSCLSVQGEVLKKNGCERSTTDQFELWEKQLLRVSWQVIFFSDYRQCFYKWRFPPLEINGRMIVKLGKKAEWTDNINLKTGFSNLALKTWVNMEITEVSQWRFYLHSSSQRKQSLRSDHYKDVCSNKGKPLNV